MGGAVLRPLLGVIAALGVALVALNLAVWQADTLAIEHERTLLTHAFQEEGLATGRLLEPLAISDEAALNIHAAFNRDWIEQEVLRRPGLAQRDATLVVMPDPSIGVAMLGREAVPQERLAPLVLRLAPAFAALRGQRNAHQPQTTSLGAGQQLVVLTRLLGRPAQVNLVTVAPLGVVAGLPPSPAPLLVSVRYLDSPGFLRGLAATYMLNDLRVLEAGQDAPASLTLTDVAGDAVLHLAWQPRRPGAALLADVAPYVWTGAGLIGFVSLWMAMGTRRAIQALGQREQDAWEAARTDSLTGLPNRRALLERAPGLLAAGPLGVVAMDFDRFKRVTEALGHAAGDRLLLATATRLAELLRDTEPDAALFHPGGDGFVLLLPLAPGEGRREMLRLFQRMRRAVRQSVLVTSGEVRMDVSGGFALASRHGTSIEPVLRRADAALQASKRTGRGCALMFEPAHDQKHEARLAMEVALLPALRDGGLHVHFQPQFDCATGALRGAEALARWTDPRLGNVSPAEFIPLAEEMGVIGEVTLLVLREAAALCTDPRVPQISVNLSVAQFRQEDFVTQALEVLRVAGIGPGCIEFEVTESVMVDDTDEAIQRFEALHAAGFALALDDFGTGFSALSYLRHFRFDRLKMDRSFVRDVARDGRARALAGSIVNLGHRLGLEVVAEGVETLDQLRALRQLRCDTVQGYLTGRPMPAEELRAVACGSPSLPTP
jgi:diguanylate cyclase (GGDEF)-like protein